jgi:hypothetical protein
MASGGLQASELEQTVQQGFWLEVFMLFRFSQSVAVPLWLDMITFLKLNGTAALVSLGQGVQWYFLLTELHMAQETQLSWFPTQAGQLVLPPVTVYSSFLII